MTEALKDGVYTRLSGYNKPKIFFAFALMAVLVNACAQPIFGGFIMSRLLVVLATPSPYLLIIHPNDKPEMKIKTALDLGRFTPKELEDNHFEVLEINLQYPKLHIIYHLLILQFYHTFV